MSWLKPIALGCLGLAAGIFLVVSLAQRGNWEISRASMDDAQSKALRIRGLTSLPSDGPSEAGAILASSAPSPEKADTTGTFGSDATGTFGSSVDELANSDEFSDSDPVEGTADVARRVAMGSAVRIHHPLKGFLGCGAIVSISASGFDVITADHVIAGVDTFAIGCFHREPSSGNLSERQHHAIKAVLEDPVVDLAYLRVASAELPAEAVPLARSAAWQNSEEFQAWALRLTEARVSRLDSVSIEPVQVVARTLARRSALDEPVSYWRLDRPSDPGISGSALVNRHGRLIGIASGNSKGNAYYCDDRELAKFFERAGLGASD